MNETADEDLTALLDGHLTAPEQTEVVRRLAAEPRLQHRLHALAQMRSPLDAAFAAMLAKAPVARLRAALAQPPRDARVSKLGGARLAASFVAAMLASAALASWLTSAMNNESDNWVGAVVDYMQLYTPETFAGVSPDSAQEAAMVAKVGARLGIGATPRDLAAPGLSFKTAFVLSYDGAALGEFVFTDAAGVPYLFCALSEHADPAELRLNTRRSFAIATWGRRDERFLVIGPSPDIVRDWSRQLAGRV